MPHSPEILMLRPSWVRESAYPLLFSAAIPALERAGFFCVGYDGDFDDLRPLLDHAAKGRFAAVAVYLHPFQVAETRSLITRLKTLSPDIPVIACGYLPTLAPGQALETGADWVLRGDPDRALAETIRAAVDRDTPPDFIARRDERGTLYPGRIVQESDLDALPMADRKVFPLLRYGHGYRSVRYPFAALYSSRGCSLACPHCEIPCLKPAGFRAHGAGRVVEEMDLLARDYGIADFHIEDDAFWTDPDRIDTLCAELRRHDTPHIWELVNGVRPEQVIPEQIPALAAAGCRRICLGIELVTEAQPRHPLEQEAARIRAITGATRRAGISTSGYFMLGYPGQTLQADAQMVALSRRLGLDMAHYSVFRPAPGSPLENDRSHSDADRQSLRELARHAYRRFYLTPRHLLWLGGELLLNPRLGPAMLEKGVGELVGTDTEIL